MKHSVLALRVSSNSCLLILNLPLLVLLTANPDIIFILLQSEDHCLQTRSVYNLKIAVEIDVLTMHKVVYRQEFFLAKVHI